MRQSRPLPTRYCKSVIPPHKTQGIRTISLLFVEHVNQQIEAMGPIPQDVPDSHQMLQAASQLEVHFIPNQSQFPLFRAIGILMDITQATQFGREFERVLHPFLH